MCDIKEKENWQDTEKVKLLRGFVIVALRNRPGLVVTETILN